jgi:hypothetical protein
MFDKLQYNVESCNTISNLIFTFSKNNQHQNISTFYITSIIFYYYSNKKIHYNNFFFTFLYKFFLLYITSITFYNHSKKKYSPHTRGEEIIKRGLGHGAEPLKAQAPSFLQKIKLKK